MSEWPTRIRSPSASSQLDTCRSLTVVPLVEFRSVSIATLPSQRISTCRRETPVSGRRNWASYAADDVGALTQLEGAVAAVLQVQGDGRGGVAGRLAPVGGVVAALRCVALLVVPALLIALVAPCWP